VDVKSSKSPTKQHKPILSKAEVEKARGESQEKKAEVMQIDVKTKKGFKDLLRF